ncbi:hypothetical protein [Pedobacter sp. UBA4863]|uniref:hypothetical protein n=1 Tax=Pedobacter sp. UBA4863 TaxID=1947060 RepID=UPI0025EBAE18|nr:hypothetical protein [Pedobacter sp. UBA4863]
MKKFLAITSCCIAIGLYVQAQTLGEFDPKTNFSQALGKIKGEKNLYIANFNVNFQVYNEKEDFKQGGRAFGGGAYKGDAKASLSVGLTGVSEKDVQEATDKLYQDFLDQVKAKGMNIITADEAGKAETYADYVKLEGGKVSVSQYAGLMTATPSNYSYYAKKVTEDGKVKKGGFLGQPHFVYAKLSKDLNDAIIANVDLFVMFVEDKNAWGGAGANIKIKTNMRLAATEAIISTSTAKIKLKGQNTVEGITSTVAFYRGKMGLGPETMYVGVLKDALPIGDVVEATKVQSYANNRTDFTGTSAGLYTIYNPENVASNEAKVIQVDGKKYAKGAYEACKKMLDHHSSTFFNRL